ncbi:hypothetical protein CYMTET_44423 [Cymbomonas tetramitiformis]|uniref:Reverse transcriptase domain-containing protein n=1 Tax=Cymbomonas tetramitiformis TaxID=36881 RepID=A0AAE0C1G5_9CHLO|nr:hypothetical protein CYMTET_44423 [Cymbomonas tetramitiformis]
MIGYRAMLEGDNEAHGGAEVVRAKLAFMEQKIYSGTEGVVADTVLTKWLAEFDTTQAKNVMPVKERTIQEYVRARKGAWRAGGASSEALQWIARGAKMRWVKGPPPNFDHGTSLRDLTPQQQEWLDIETTRAVKTGAWVRARRRRHVSRLLLVPKPGSENSWRLVYDFRWLNDFCVKSKCKMETLTKLRRLASQGDWCFTFDLKDGYHAIGIDPDFQVEFMQFDVQGVLYQCGALPFGWTDSPRIFVKLMKTRVELIRSPQAGEDRHEVKKLRDGQEVRRRWAVRRREGGLRRGSDRAGARVLPYMDDFMVITKTQDDAFVQRDRVSKLLPRLGLFRNEKKGHWEPTQLVEHLGLEVDFEEGLAIPCDGKKTQEDPLQGYGDPLPSYSRTTLGASEGTGRVQWTLPVSVPSSADGQTVPTRALLCARQEARLGIQGEADEASLGRPTVVGQTASDEQVEWSQILAKPDKGEAAHRLLHVRLGRSPEPEEGNTRFLDERRASAAAHHPPRARSGLQDAVRSFLSELEGKVVRLYCDNQAVVAMLSHFTSRNPELMRRMRKLWLLLDLHDIELQARYIRSEANEWADRLSRDKDLDDWRINKRWFKYAEEQWGEHSVDRFASEISAQLPRYYSAWHDPGCEGVDSLAYDWRGEHNWVNPPWGLLDEVAHKLREEGAAATVVAPYWPGQSWFRELEALAAEVLGRSLVSHPRLPVSVHLRAGGVGAGQGDEEINKPEEEVRPGCKIEVFWPEDQVWYPGTVGATGEDGRTKIQYDDGDVENVVLKEEKYRLFPSENEEEEEGEEEENDRQQQVTATPWKTALLRHWTEKLGKNQHSDTAAAMQAAALEKSTADNYERHWKKFVKFCTEENLRWLPATAATVQLYLAALQKTGTVKGTSLQPYLSAINSFHEDFGFQGPAKGRAVTRAVKGMTAMQTAAAEQQDVTETVRTFLPASAVRPHTGTAMLRESLLRDSNGLSIVLEKEKGKNHLLCMRRLYIPREGVAELHELLDRWEQARDEDWPQAATTSTARAADTASYWRLPCDKKKQFKNVDANEWIACALGHLSSAVHAYIDPTALADADMVYYFGWLTPGWKQTAAPMG